jgi:RNA polymerase sigma factor (TIGR02999 family)
MTSPPELPHPTSVDPDTDEIFIRVYAELKQLARGYLRRERSNHTLQPTALVNEAYLRMSRLEPGRWPDRKAFLGIAARAMRRILVDHARRRNAGKRAAQTVTVDEGTLASTESTVDLLALDRALDTLARSNAQHGKIVELHLFGGLTVGETAGVLQVTERTVYRQLRSARAWLQTELRICTAESRPERPR